MTEEELYKGKIHVLNKKINILIEEKEKLKQEKDSVYCERNQLVAALSKIFPSWLEECPAEDKEDNWQNIVFIQFPTGQGSWHIHDKEMQYFAHLTSKEGNSWDGHSSEEKYNRIEKLKQENPFQLSTLSIIESKNKEERYEYCSQLYECWELIEHVNIVTACFIVYIIRARRKVLRFAAATDFICESGDIANLLKEVSKKLESFKKEISKNLGMETSFLNTEREEEIKRIMNDWVKLLI